MKKNIRQYLVTVAVMLILFLGGNVITVSAAVAEGNPGELLGGEYVVIVNTSTEEAQSTGTLIFDAAANTSAETVQTSSLQSDVAAGSGSLQSSAAEASVSYQIGQSKYISGPNGGGTYICIGEGSHCYVWMEEGMKTSYDAAGKTDLIASDMSGTYDDVPYETLYAMCGGAMPYRDHSGKLSILLEEITTGASGMYKNDDGITAIHINVPAPLNYQAGEMLSRNGLLVHEGQHALFSQLAQYDASQPYLWLNEGLSVAAMDYIWGGTDNSGWLDRIAGSAEIRSGSSLFYKNYRGNTAQDYAMPYLFVRYLIDRKAGGYRPMSVFPLFYAQSAKTAPDSYLSEVMGDGTSFSDLLTDFYTAIIAQEPSGKYGFSGDSVAASKAGEYPLFSGESGKSYSLEPTAAIIVRLENGAFQVPDNGGENIRYMVVGDGRKPAVPVQGKGTFADPYLITSFQELNLVGNDPDAYYRLEQDIEADGDVNLTVANFRGVLNGNGHKIKGLRYPLTGTNSGMIKNLTIEASIRGEFRDMLGIFSLRNAGTIADCRAAGKVNGKLGASGTYGVVYGSFAGENAPAGVIKNCASFAHVILGLPAQRSRIGGITGVHSGRVENCSSAGSITVEQPYGDYDVCVGGLVGEIHPMGVGGSISNCVHLGSIVAQGGLQSLGQICGTAYGAAAANPGNYLTGCYGKSGNLPATGIPETGISDQAMLLDENMLKDETSYTGWTFGSDWKITENGPELMGPDDIQSIETTNTLYCYVGEKPYSWGNLLVNGHVNVKITEDMINGFDSSSPGEKNVIVTYKNKSAVLNVVVSVPSQEQVAKLQVSSVRHKNYVEGQYFDPAGVCLLATVNGSIRYIYDGFTYEPQRPLTSEDDKVVFSYFGAEVSAPITVSRIVPSSISALSKMEHTQYQEGGKLDLSGVKVQVTYNNGVKSEIITSDEFETYGIYVAKRSASGEYTVIPAAQPVSFSDSGSSIFVYAGDVMPGTYGAVLSQAGTITVTKRLQMSDETLHMSQNGEEQFVYSQNIAGGSGIYRAAVVAEHLPAGVVRTVLPLEGGNSYFAYQGIPSTTGRYTSVYRIEDVQTGEEKQVAITVEVHPANTAQMFQFNLYAAQNPGLTEDVIGIIGEATILLTVPYGTDVTSLVPNIDYGSYMGVTVPDGFINGTVHNFSSPVTYQLLAPDHKTTKLYTVYVEVRSQDAGNTGAGGSGGGSGDTGNNSSGSGTGGTGNTGNGSGDTGNNSSGSGTDGTGNTGSGSGNSTTVLQPPIAQPTPTQPQVTPSQPQLPQTSSQPNKLILPKTVYGKGCSATIAKTKFVYNGKSQRPGITVMYGRKKLKQKYYSVTYSANKKPGLATVTVKGKGAFKKKLSVLKLQFVIVPKKMTIAMAKSSKKGTLTVGWKPDKLSGGYQLQISSNGTFKGNVLSYDIKKTKSSKTVNGLQKKKTYYTRIRPYVKIKNTIFYGSWSKVKKVKIK
ncbi:MAG: DUF5018 domain-containing protein [Lachnospiraceae bacterium]|nr:DUF5018 domain-containing protein [Lachnospiraceae bacterium]MDY3730818.1 hypothetical protein [Candidatus Choladocola sp.]